MIHIVQGEMAIPGDGQQNTDQSLPVGNKQTTAHV
jgi:hypothetical protein